MVTPVSELDVLIGACKWLHENLWEINGLSLATGFGLPSIETQKDKVKQALEDAGIPFDVVRMERRGPDIVARLGQEVWKLECKGIADARPQTHRNNFDRAVASVISYYDSQHTRLGLALANDYLWNYNFSDRLPKALRKAIGLWVFLVENGEAYAYPPDDYLPYPGANN